MSVIELKKIKLIVPSIFVPIRGPMDDRPLFRTLFQCMDPVIDPALSEIGIFPRTSRWREGLFYKTTALNPPFVAPESREIEDFDKISKLMTIARNCNLRLDGIEGIFYEMVVGAIVESFEYRMSRHKTETALHLNGIIVPLQELRERVMSFGKKSTNQNEG